MRRVFVDGKAKTRKHNWDCKILVTAFTCIFPLRGNISYGSKNFRCKYINTAVNTVTDLCFQDKTLKSNLEDATDLNHLSVIYTYKSFGFLGVMKQLVSNWICNQFSKLAGQLGRDLKTQKRRSKFNKSTRSKKQTNHMPSQTLITRSVPIPPYPLWASGI